MLTLFDTTGLAPSSSSTQWVFWVVVWMESQSGELTLGGAVEYSFSIGFGGVLHIGARDHPLYAIEDVK